MKTTKLPQAVRDDVVRGFTIVGLAAMPSSAHGFLATVFSAPGGSRHVTAADVLVRLRPAAVAESSAVLTEAGGTLVAEELDLWKLPAAPPPRSLRTLEASGSVAFSEREATYVASVSSIAVSDQFVPQQWWRSAIGVDGLTPRAPGFRSRSSTRASTSIIQSSSGVPI